MFYLLCFLINSNLLFLIWLTISNSNKLISFIQNNVSDQPLKLQPLKPFNLYKPTRNFKETQPLNSHKDPRGDNYCNYIKSHRSKSRLCRARLWNDRDWTPLSQNVRTVHSYCSSKPTIGLVELRAYSGWNIYEKLG